MSVFKRKVPTIADVVKESWLQSQFDLHDAELALERALANLNMCREREARLRNKAGADVEGSVNESPAEMHEFIKRFDRHHPH